MKTEISAEIGDWIKNLKNKPKTILVKLPDTVGELCSPQLRLFNDVAHIDGLKAENVFDNWNKTAMAFT